MKPCYYCGKWIPTTPRYSVELNVTEQQIDGAVVLTPIWICILCNDYELDEED